MNRQIQPHAFEGELPTAAERAEWNVHDHVAPGGLRPMIQPFHVGMHRGRMELAALESERDFTGGEVHVFQGHPRFGGAAPLGHEKYPVLAHPFGFARQAGFDLGLILQTDFCLHLCRRSAQFDLGASVDPGEASPHGLPAHHLQEAELIEGAVMRNLSARASVAGAPRKELHRHGVVEMTRGQDRVRAQKEFARFPIAPHAAFRGFVVDIAGGEIIGHPGRPVLSVFDALELEFGVRGLVCHDVGLVAGVRRSNAMAGGFAGRFSGAGITEFEPEKRGLFALVNGCHIGVPMCATAGFLTASVNCYRQATLSAVKVNIMFVEKRDALDLAFDLFHVA